MSASPSPSTRTSDSGVNLVRNSIEKTKNATLCPLSQRYAMRISDSEIEEVFADLEIMANVEKSYIFVSAGQAFYVTL